MEDSDPRQRPILEKNPFVYDSIAQTAKPIPAERLNNERRKDERMVRTQLIGRGKRRVKVTSPEDVESILATVHIPAKVWVQRLTTKHYKEMWIVTWG